MTTPKASIQDLVTTSNNSTQGSPASDFISMLTKHALNSTSSPIPMIGTDNPVGRLVNNTITDVGNNFISPLQQLYSTVAMRLDPAGRKQLDAISNNKNLSESQKTDQINQLGQSYGGSSNQQMESAGRGADMVFQGSIGGPEMQAAAPSIDYATNKALNMGTDALNSSKKAIGDVIDTGGAQPGGLQAGFARIPGKEGLPPIESGSNLLRDKRMSVDNPNAFKANTNPKGSGYAQEPPAYPETPVNPNLAGLNKSTDPIAPITKPVIPDQPGLTTAQQKVFAKNGLDQYQLPASYADKRVPLENIDKSVMANVIGGNSPEEIMKNIPAAEKRVWTQVTDKAKTIPAIDINKGVITHIDNNLQDLVHQGTITPEEAAKRLEEEKLNIFSKANDLKNPTTISGSNLINLQTGANKVDPKNIPQGMINPTPYMNKAVARGYRDAIGGANPDIRYAYNQYSSIKRIGEMSNTFRNTAGKPPTFIDRLKQNPALAIGAAALGVPEVIGGAKAIGPLAANAGAMGLNLASTGVNGLASSLGYVPKGDAANPQKDEQITHPGVIPQNTIGVNTHMPIQDIKNATGVPITQDEYNQNILNPAYAPGSTARKNLDEQIALTHQTATQNMPGNIPQFMGTASAASTAYQTLNGTNLSELTKLYNKLSASNELSSYTSSPSKPYARELSMLNVANNYYQKALKDTTGGSVDDRNNIIKAGDSPEQIKEKLSYQANFTNETYSHYQPYWDAINPTANGSTNPTQGNQTQTSPSTYQQNTQGLPSAPPALPGGFHIGGGAIPSLNGLPPIQ